MTRPGCHVLALPHRVERLLNVLLDEAECLQSTKHKLTLQINILKVTVQSGDPIVHIILF